MQSTLSDAAYDTIRERILAGDLPPGSRLVNRTLGKELGISTIPIREALRRLATEGLVEHFPGAGTFVRKFDRADLINLYSFREGIECLATRRAANFIREDMLQQLEAICEGWHDLAEEVRTAPEQCSTAEQFRRGLEYDLAFHEILIRAADNPWLTKTVEDMRLMTRVAQSKTHRSATFAELCKNYRQHAALVRELRKRDPETASYWMKVQIREGLRFLLEKQGMDTTGIKAIPGDV